MIKNFCRCIFKNNFYIFQEFKMKNESSLIHNYLNIIALDVMTEKTESNDTLAHQRREKNPKRYDSCEKFRHFSVVLCHIYTSYISLFLIHTKIFRHSRCAVTSLKWSSNFKSNCIIGYKQSILELSGVKNQLHIVQMMIFLQIVYLHCEMYHVATLIYSITIQ